MEFQQFDTSSWVGSLAAQLGPISTMAFGTFANKSPYFGTDIVPEKRVGAPVEMQFTKTTPETIKKIAGILNMSPAMLEFYISAWGGVPQDLTKTVDAVFNPSKFKEAAITDTGIGTASKYPIIKRMLRETLPSYSPEAVHNKKILKESEIQSTGVKLKIEDQANEIINKIKLLESPQEKINYLNSLGDALTPEIKKKIISLMTVKQTVEALNIYKRNDVRALYILKRVQEMKKAEINPQEIKAFLDELTIKKILTDDVKKKMVELLQSNP